MADRWIEVKNKNGTCIALRCPKCEQSPKYAVRSKFCPNCGADLQVKEDSTNPCDWCTRSIGDHCNVKECIGWSRFNPIAGTPLFIEQKVDDMHDSYLW